MTDMKQYDNEIPTLEHPILLFDGVCNFCDNYVQFLIKHDKKGTYRFAPIQSPIGQRLLQQNNFPTDKISTVVLLEGGKLYTKSTVGLRIFKELGGLWSLLYPFILIPKPIRDIVYDFLAKNRYKWFGEKEACMIPPPEVRSRFLE